MLIIIILIVIGILVHTNYVKVQTYKLSKGDLDLRIGHISDIHHKIKYINGGLSDILNKYNLDFLIVTGDLGSDEKSIATVIEEIKRVQVKQKSYFVLGNYERIGKIKFKKVPLNIDEKYFLKFDTEKFKTLINEYEIFLDEHNRILFYGFDNSIYGNEQYNNDLDKEEFSWRILFAHSPNILSYINARQIEYDMLLVGHTHGNQINIPLINKINNGYSYIPSGYKCENHKVINVSRGLGTSRLPIRINSAPQITIFSLEREESRDNNII